MIYRCKACDAVFGSAEVERVTNQGVPYYKTHGESIPVDDVVDGLCPCCTLATIEGLDINDFVAGSIRTRLTRGD